MNRLGMFLIISAVAIVAALSFFQWQMHPGLQTGQMNPSAPANNTTVRPSK